MRCSVEARLFQFEQLSADEIKDVVLRAIRDENRGFGSRKIEIDDDALDFLADTSEGDARRALAALEVGVLSSHR